MGFLLSHIVYLYLSLEREKQRIFLLQGVGALKINLTFAYVGCNFVFRVIIKKKD